MKLVSFSLRPVAPFRLDYTVWALRRRPDNIVDQWENGQYMRVFNLGGNAVYYVSSVQLGPPQDPVLAVRVAGERISTPDIEKIDRMLTRMLGLDSELADFYALAEKDDHLGPLAREFYGVKPPRFGTVYEALVNAVACQQMSLLVGIRLLNRLAQAYGKAFMDFLGPRGAGNNKYAFPSPDGLAKAMPPELRALGFSGRKAQYIIGISRSAAQGTADCRSAECVGPDNASFDVEALDALPDEKAETKLLSLKGVGRTVARWHPYGGLIYFHLLLKNLRAKGFLPAERQEVPV